MTTLLALTLGLGVLLVYDASTGPPRQRRERRSRISARVAAWLASAGLATVPPRQFVMGCATSACACALGVLVALGSPTVAALACVAGVYAPIAYVRARRRGRRRALLQCWPEVVELLAGAVRAGDTLPAAAAVVAERGPAPLRGAFGALVADHRVSGDFVRALERLGAMLADPTADRVVVTLSVAYRVGGRELGRVLRTLAAFLREDLAIRREIEARQSWTIVAARVAAGAPWLVLLLVATHADALRAYDSVPGIVVLVGGATATVFGYRLMLVLGRLPDEPRMIGLVS